MQQTVGDYGSNAYMLVYEKMIKKDISVVENEVESKIDFHSIERFVPDWLEREIEQDNLNTLMDRQVFNPSFFLLIKIILREISSLTMTSHKYHHTYR